jgi:enamine deaminase RidA (YjgF/YER057c/UK114 family)
VTPKHNSYPLPNTAIKSFRGQLGGDEHYISLTADGEGDFTSQIRKIEHRYSDALRSLDLDPETAIFRRLFVSDSMNQASLLDASALARSTVDNPVAVSLVQQPPLPGAKLALLAYHISGDQSVRKNQLSTHEILIEKKGRRHLWTTGLCSEQDTPDPSSAIQARRILSHLIESLEAHHGSLSDNCVRTWFYLKDVDVFYQGMVEARSALFSEQGLTTETHYIASTGIEGGCAHRYDVVAMDAYSNLDLVPQQMSFLNDFSRLCATKDYNVHFERGTSIAYADRTHHFISGTASIDTLGRVVHAGNVTRQTEYALGHVEALLRSGSADLSDLGHVIAYLRDPTDYARVSEILRHTIPNIPTVFVQGAVCRPQWLVELEGIAISAHEAPSLPSF